MVGADRQGGRGRRAAGDHRRPDTAGLGERGGADGDRGRAHRSTTVVSVTVPVGAGAVGPPWTGVTVVEMTTFCSLPDVAEDGAIDVMAVVVVSVVTVSAAAAVVDEPVKSGVSGV